MAQQKVPVTLVSIQEALTSDPVIRSAAVSAGTTLALGVLASKSPKLFRLALGGLAVWTITGGVKVLRNVLKGG